MVLQAEATNGDQSCLDVSRTILPVRPTLQELWRLNGMSATVELRIGRQFAGDSDAIVIASKTRSAPVQEAVDSSVQALRWLRNEGCRQFFFKYCSTFDSTSHGNIGPVAEALMDELGGTFTIACPAFPANGRTVYNGHLFVGDMLLEETSMRSHPLTPMTNSNLVLLLQAQCNKKVGLIRYSAVREGSLAISESIRAEQANGVQLAIVDAICESDLRQIAKASQHLPLWTGASGLAIGLADVFRHQGLLNSTAQPERLDPVVGLSAILSGSCSEMTQRQVNWMAQRAPALHLDPRLLVRDPDCAASAVEWARSHMHSGPVLISTTGDAEAVKAVQSDIGVDRAGTTIERCLAEIAQGLVANGVRRLIVAGGETSGAVLAALGVARLRIGPCIDPGVHWAVCDDEPRLALALKSGNFGTEDFFERAWSVLP